MLLTFTQIQTIIFRYGSIEFDKPKKGECTIIAQPKPMPSFRIDWTNMKSDSTGEKLYKFDTLGAL